MDGSPLSAADLRVVQAPGSPLSVKIDPTTRGFQVAFGTTTQRHGFAVTSMTLDARVDIACEQLMGRVVLTIPGMSTAQPFGGTTIGAALGPPNVDVDSDGAPDSWRVAIEGTATSVLVP
jgi:hypothetical protein